MTRILLDTDVNLDFILARQPFFGEAEEIFVQIAQNKIEAYIASITAINIYYFGRKEKAEMLFCRNSKNCCGWLKSAPWTRQCCKML